MLEVPRSRDTDWLVPAILVGVAIVAVLVVVGVAASVSGSGEDETMAQELETWSRCLRTQGAPVPLVESLRDGGFRVTFDATVLDGAAEIATASAAFDACRGDAPDLVREFADRLDMFGGFASGRDLFGFLPGDDSFGFEHGPLYGDSGPFDGVEPGVRDLDELTLDELCGRVVDRLESG
ncbi:MAG: hypothetical protein M3094_03950, partial [Actinomycetia bacterium]|nr:hypothetical protein [Actinomycetes bacterium]